jgi:hypothetical protein
VNRCCPLQRFARRHDAAGPCSDLPWRWSSSGCWAGKPSLWSPNRVLASPIQRPAAARSSVTSSRRSASRFLAFEDPPTCRWRRCRRGRSGSARVRRSLSFAAGRPASSPGVSKMPLRRYQRAASGPGGERLATIPTFGQRGATLPGAFRPCRSSRLRRVAPLRASQGPRSWGPGSTRVKPAPIGVSPATDPGVHAVSAPAALSALSRSARVSFDARFARSGRSRAARRRVPGHALPFEAFPSSAAVPTSPPGVAFSPVQAAALAEGAVANHALRLRWRLPAARPCSAAEVR